MQLCHLIEQVEEALIALKTIQATHGDLCCYEYSSGKDILGFSVITPPSPELAEEYYGEEEPFVIIELTTE